MTCLSQSHISGQTDTPLPWKSHWGTQWASPSNICLWFSGPPPPPPRPNLLSVRRWLVPAHTLRLFLYSLKVQCHRNKTPSLSESRHEGIPGARARVPICCPESAVLYEYKSIIVPSQATLEIPATFLAGFFSTLLFSFFFFLLNLFIQHTE